MSLQDGLSRLQGSKAYTTVDHLSGKQIAETPIPFPPVEEQQRIVARVDELMALCDKLEAQQQERARSYSIVSTASFTSLTNQASAFRLHSIFEDLRYLPPTDLRAALAMLALKGEISDADQQDASVFGMLEDLDAARRKYALAYGTKLPKLRTIGDEIPFRIKPSWTWVRLNRLFNFITDGDHQPPPRSPSEGNQGQVLQSSTVNLCSTPCPDLYALSLLAGSIM
ncbi:hypothetical protein G3480_24130 [Thiorhodococcus mannitoliphagus]|uniref:Type I restriction modification DNA specificity domain-containing protein n=1 Tax=Thiorhodococcus mannitoliphagus TaxID=329406 RepID=A0A6P1E5P0_9GAMM|nr:restriction endonuclease subunit S [Thiorhodococcus mannitoliphagus]NEX23344.1 hypothetical protein [Thiorhodococcus mannitoliphagus]